MNTHNTKIVGHPKLKLKIKPLANHTTARKNVERRITHSSKKSTQ